MANKVPPDYDFADLKKKVESAYQCEVAALLPLAIEVAENASSALSCLRSPDHLFSLGVRQVAGKLEEETVPLSLIERE